MTKTWCNAHLRDVPGNLPEVEPRAVDRPVEALAVAGAVGLVPALAQGGGALGVWGGGKGSMRNCGLVWLGCKKKYIQNILLWTIEIIKIILKECAKLKF